MCVCVCVCVSIVQKDSSFKALAVIIHACLNLFVPFLVYFDLLESIEIDSFIFNSLITESDDKVLSSMSHPKSGVFGMFK